MIGEPAASAIFVIVHSTLVHSQQGYVLLCSREEAEWRAGVAQLQLHSLATSDLSVGCVTRLRRWSQKCSHCRLMQQAIMQYSQPLIAASTTSIKRGHKPRAADGVRNRAPFAVMRRGRQGAGGAGDGVGGDVRLPDLSGDALYC